MFQLETILLFLQNMNVVFQMKKKGGGGFSSYCMRSAVFLLISLKKKNKKSWHIWLGILIIIGISFNELYGGK